MFSYRLELQPHPGLALVAAASTNVYHNLSEDFLSEYEHTYAVASWLCLFIDLVLQLVMRLASLQFDSFRSVHMMSVCMSLLPLSPSNRRLSIEKGSPVC